MIWLGSKFRWKIYARFVDLEFRVELLSKFRAMGFKFVTIDLEGFRSGSLNNLVPAEDLFRGHVRGRIPLVRG